MYQNEKMEGYLMKSNQSGLKVYLLLVFLVPYLL